MFELWIARFLIFRQVLRTLRFLLEVVLIYVVYFKQLLHYNLVWAIYFCKVWAALILYIYIPYYTLRFWFWWAWVKESFHDWWAPDVDEDLDWIAQWEYEQFLDYLLAAPHGH